MRVFETAGNAIVIAYDDRPVLTTDPWITRTPISAVYSIANRNQDSMLPIDVNGRLVINLNGSSDYGESFRAASGESF